VFRAGPHARKGMPKSKAAASRQRRMMGAADVISFHFFRPDRPSCHRSIMAGRPTTIQAAY
jgi:hypothetical protein